MPEQTSKLTPTAEATEVTRGDAKLAGEEAAVIAIDRKPVQFECNVSPRKECYRLVHDGKRVLSLFSSVGLTHTRNELFCGTQEECDAEIARLGLAQAVEVNPDPSAESGLTDAEIAAAVRSDPSLRNRVARIARREQPVTTPPIKLPPARVGVSEITP